ncbi:MAG: hypothetical protein JWP54_127, partial [Cryobacterium sp.]|nr:hypothetical protein [Cryobacterium sp.]
MADEPSHDLQGDTGMFVLAVSDDRPVAGGGVR